MQICRIVILLMDGLNGHGLTLLSFFERESVLSRLHNQGAPDRLMFERLFVGLGPIAQVVRAHA